MMHTTTILYIHMLATVPGSLTSRFLFHLHSYAMTQITLRRVWTTAHKDYQSSLSPSRALPRTPNHWNHSLLQPIIPVITRQRKIYGDYLKTSPRQASYPIHGPTNPPPAPSDSDTTCPRSRRASSRPSPPSPYPLHFPCHLLLHCSHLQLTRP